MGSILAIGVRSVNPHSYRNRIAAAARLAEETARAVIGFAGARRDGMADAVFAAGAADHYRFPQSVMIWATSAGSSAP